MAKKKGWDGTPPVHTYPFAIRNAAHLWGEPGLNVWMAEDGDFYSFNFHRDHPVVKVMKRTEKGDAWFNGWNNTSGGTPDTYECIAELPLTEKPWMPDGYREAGKLMEEYARTELGVTIFKP